MMELETFWQKKWNNLIEKKKKPVSVSVLYFVFAYAIFRVQKTNLPKKKEETFHFF